MKKILFLLTFLLLSFNVEAQRSCLGGSTINLGGTNLALDNNDYLLSVDAAGTGFLSILKGDTTDDTVLNCKSGELIKLSENGTAGFTLDPSTAGVTFASLAELGSDSLTDAIDAANYSDGTVKAKDYFAANVFTRLVTTNHTMAWGVNNAAEMGLSATALAPVADGGNALGSATLGWKGAYFSDGTDKWSLVPGVNLLTLAAGTADGADDQKVSITGGGECLANRGACLNLYGEDAAGGNAGIAGIVSGTNAPVYIIASGTGDAVFQTAGTTKWTFSNGGNLTQDAINGGNIVMAKASTAYINGASAVPADIIGLIGTPAVYIFGNYAGWVQRGSNDSSGPVTYIAKSRATDGSGDVAVQANDVLGTYSWRGSDGTGLVGAATISASVDGTPGTNDMPTRLAFAVSPDGSATAAEAMRISQDKTVTVKNNIVFDTAGTGISSVASSASAAGSTQADAGAWSVISGFNYATGADGTKGVKFPAIATIGLDRIFSLQNMSASALKLYSNAAGALINDVAGTTAYSVPAWAIITCYVDDATHIYCG